MKKAVSFLLSVVLIISCVLSVSFAVTSETTTSYRYENRFRMALLGYNDFSLLTEDYFPVPGLEKTALSETESCDAMTPQGLCVTDDYIFISAYCGIKRYKADLEENIGFGNNEEKLLNEENHKVHNSVIYILSRDTGAYLKTIVLPDSNHVGGLATDGKNIFIAKSTDKQISVITENQIKLLMSLDTVDILNLENYLFTADCDCTASFVTYFEGVLWVGVFNEKEKGELNGFKVNPLFGLEKVSSVEIPAKANGASFAELNGEICLNINSSYGRKNVSKIYLYSVENFASENMTIDKKGIYTVPPTVQNSAVIDGKVYFIYESAATCYSQVESFFETKSTTCPIDRVCIGEAENLFNWHCDNLFLARISAFVRSVKAAVGNIF